MALSAAEPFLKSAPAAIAAGARPAWPQPTLSLRHRAKRSALGRLQPPWQRWQPQHSQTQAAAAIESAALSEQDRAEFSESGLALDSEASVASEGRSVLSIANVAAHHAGCYASSQQASDPGLKFSQGHSHSSLSFCIDFKRPISAVLDLHLSGTLRVNGPRSGVLPWPSRAVVAAYALGSTSDGDLAGRARLFRQLGLAQELEGEALLAQLRARPCSGQPQLQTFGARTGAHMQDLVIEQQLSVQADSHCLGPEDGVDPSLYGRHRLSFELFLFTEAQNGAVADFSPGLSLEALHLPEDCALSFEPGAELPVHALREPELRAAGGLLSRGWSVLLGRRDERAPLAP